MTEELPICSFCAWQGVMGSRAGEKESCMRSGYTLLPAAIVTVQPLLNKAKLDYGRGGGEPGLLAQSHNRSSSGS